MFLIVLADYCLVMRENYFIGVALFMNVQALYYYQMTKNFHLFYALFFCLGYSLYLLGIVYAVMSLVNIYVAYRTRHWLLITLLLLGACDICVMIQYLWFYSLPILWFFYLFSQVYYLKMVSA